MNRNQEIFKPDIGKVNNNKKTYYSFLDDRSYFESEDIEESPIDFINRLSKSGSYIFNKDVVIITKDRKYETKIAGKIGNKVITLDNDSININEIVKIYQK